MVLSCGNRSLNAVGVAMALLLLTAASPRTRGADLGGDCCTDLEERVSELDAAAAKHQNRKVELTVSGVVSTAILGYYDGLQSDAYVVTNDNDGVNLTIEGEAADIDDGPWSAGFVIELDVNQSPSSEVSQRDDNGSSTSGLDSVTTGDVAVWAKHDRLGTLTLGETKGGSDATQEFDLSGTTAASYVNVSDIGGSFELRTATSNSLVDLTWGDVLDSFPGVSGSLIRYELPEFAGFTISAAWGEDDVWDAGAKYGGGVGDFKLDAGLGYAEDQEGIDSEVANSRTVTGSVSALHVPTGLSITLAGGARTFTSDIELNDGSLGRPEDQAFGYGKLGWQGDLADFGTTALYGELGIFSDTAGRGVSADAIAGIAGIDPDAVCGGVGIACFAAGSEGRIWGLGVVQSLKESDVQLYLGFRHQELDLSLTDRAGARVLSNGFDGIDLVTGGMKIEF